MSEQRRLVAIVAADVAGYSRLMGRDESGTLAALKSLRREVVDPRIAAHGGRIVKTTGDGLLLEFPSVVDAVRCAVELQNAMATSTAGVEEDRRIAFRIGVNLGDIIIDGDDIFGDGVNIAARLEAIAEPGGLCVSQAVYDSVRGKIDIAFVDGGRPELKNIAVPVSVWHWQRDGKPAVKAVGAGASLPVIAVLPFQNRSSDSEQEYFSDGITEDIIASLSKFRAFHVIARNTTFAFKGNALDIAAVGRALKADYLVDGSVRSLGSRVRITAQLIDVAQGTTLWTERYDRELKDVFELQDEITARIAAGVDPAIRGDQTRRALGKHPADLKAWDHLLRGLWHLNRFRKDANAEARREFEAGVERDGRFAPARAWLAMTHIFDAWFNWTDRHAEQLERAGAAAAEAVRLDDSEPMSHVAAALACFWTRRMEQAKHAAERALALNPNSFLANFVCGAAGNYSGLCEAAVPYHLKALDLSPNDPLAWNCLGSLAHTWLNLGRFDDAVACADRALVQRHGYLFGRLIKIAALGHAGRIGDARAAVATLFDVAPDFSLSRLDHYPFVLASQKDHLLRGLSLAGLHGSVPAPEAPAASPALALPDKPSIAVLPFQNMSGEPEQDYFADGMVEDIITALARFRSLFVIARNSSFTYKGKAADIKQVGRELGVRYVLEGSVRKAGGRIRVTAQLIEAATGNHIWAERYDRTLEDVFAVQEDLTGSIVGAIAPQIEASEKAAALRRAPANLTAYERAARASALVWRGNDKADSATLDMAVEEARRAIAIDPGSVLAFQTVARAQSMKLFLQLADDREKLLHEAWYAAVRAIELDGADPASYAIRAFCTFMSGERERYAEALADARRAHDSNPNDIFNLLILAYIEIRLGEPESALERARLMLRLNPRAERLQDVYNLHAFACFGAARYAEGVEWARRALRDMPSLVPAHSNLVTCLVGMGEIDQARVAFATASALAPEYFRVRLEGQSLYYRPHDRERQVRFLRIAAGLDAPDGGQPAGDTAK